MKTINEYLSSSENLLDTTSQIATDWSYDESTNQYYLIAKDGTTYLARLDANYVLHHLENENGEYIVA